MATTKENRKKGVRIVLTCLAVLALHCRFEIFVGDFPDNFLLNGLHKLYNTFNSPDFVDLFVWAAIYMMLKYVSEKDERIELSSVILSLLLSVTLIASISFKKYNSADFIFANSYQIIIAFLCTIGFGIVIYGVMRCVCFLFERSIPKREEGERSSFLERHFLPVGFGIIFLGWLPWILMNYPGSGCPDSVLQLRQYLGDTPWGVIHPPLSTAIMGGLFTIGSLIADANFGFFLYCFFQTCVGAWIFSLSMKKLLKLGIPVKWCMVGIAYFAFTPLWGTYAQWVEKDLLYAEMVVLQTVCMLEIIAKKECSRKDAILLCLTSLGAVFLRNNGIYAILPALLLMAIWLKKAARIRVAAVLLLVFVSYEGVMNGLFPALGMGKTPAGEPLSILFQQTARYVCEHTDEVTEHEKEVIDREFGWESMFNYNPVLSDPIKIRYKSIEPAEYFEIWGGMFFKHPETYVSAFINKSYGYLAPVSQNIEAWIQGEYYDYMKQIDLYHVFDLQYTYLLQWIWNLSQQLPLIKYLCTPGLYTWIIVLLTKMLLKRRKYSALILFVPSFMNILVCLASPMASAIRYELPTVASVPMLIGWAYLTLSASNDSIEI